MRARLFCLFHFVAPVCDVTNTSSAGKSHPITTLRRCLGSARKGSWQHGNHHTAPLTYLYRLGKSTPLTVVWKLK